MIVLAIDKLTSQEKIDLIRKLLNSLSPMERRVEVERANRIEHHKPAYLIEAPDGTSYITDSVKGVRSYIDGYVGKRPDISNIYKVIRGQSKTIYGLTIKEFYEGE